MTQKTTKEAASRIDQEILKYIRAGRTHFYQFQGISREIYGVPNWRIIDRRVQAMRRAGKIVYKGQSQGWVLAEVA